MFTGKGVLFNAALKFETQFAFLSRYFGSAAATRSKQTRLNNIAKENRAKVQQWLRRPRKENRILFFFFSFQIRNTIPEHKIALPSPPLVHLEQLMLCYYSAGWSSFSQSPGVRRRLSLLAQPLLCSSLTALTAGSLLPKPGKDTLH